ncbi:MAG: 6,7-dimethyl-8-ribityllumazine synthase [Planctomycetes bacterium]|nr:6,7-dimethyl-8-ribityllumazine synthase [Planctomycetota bacterium]
MGKEYSAPLSATGKSFAIIVARFNDFITSKLVDGAIDAIVRHGGSAESIDIVRVPGAWEVPLACKWVVAKNAHDAVICLGAVIRGSTPHFDVVAGESAKGIAQIMLESSTPVVNGILTTDTIEQAIERAGTKMGNKGWEAAMSAIEMASLMRELDA